LGKQGEQFILGFMKEKFSLKDHLFNLQKLEKIGTEISQVYPAFKRDAFLKTTVAKFPELELKQRITWIAEQLKRYLPPSYQEAVAILLASLPRPCDPSLSDDDFGDFIYAPYSEFVAKYGCKKEDLAFSLDALKSITTRFSAEDAIRYFINAFPTDTMNTLLHWTTDSHYHVRRLASEGTRPKLPWSQKIVIKPEETFPILDRLYADRTRFVTRSVANHLNDISKLNPASVIDSLAAWQQSKKQSEKEMTFMIKHALRTAVKQGHPGAISFLGVSPNPQVTVSGFCIKTPQVTIGDAVEFSCVITALKKEKVIVDYSIHFQNKAGTMANKKMYKLKQFTVEPGDVVTIEKRHLFRAGMTTRILYPGEHQVAIQVNGQKVGSGSFELKL